MKLQEIHTVCEVFNGKTPSASEQQSSGLPILKIRDIDENGKFRGCFESFVDQDFYNKYSNKCLKTCDTIILNAAHNADYVGSKNALIPKKLEGVIATGEWLIVRPKEANGVYINHFLKSPLGRRALKTRVKGIHLYPKDVENIKIPLPHSDDQIRIAYLLSKVEGLIAQRKEHLQQLDGLLKSVFLEMFGDPVRNEKGWEKRTAIDYANCIVPGRDKPRGFNGVIPWVTTNDLQNLGHTFTSKQGIGLSDEEINEVRARVIPAGSILITCVGDLGVTSICGKNMVVNQQLHAFQVKEGMNNVFFMYAISFQNTYMYRNASTTTVPYMNKTVCNRIPMISPPIDLQNQFAAIFKKVEWIKSHYQYSLTELENLYGALSQKAFKGELDLSRVPLPVGTTLTQHEETNLLERAGEQQGTFNADLGQIEQLDTPAMSTAQGRTKLLERLFETYIKEQHSGAPLSLDDFWQNMQFQTSDYMDEDSKQIGLADYDQVKKYLFRLLESGEVIQTFNEDKNRIELHVRG